MMCGVKGGGVSCEFQGAVGGGVLCRDSRLAGIGAHLRRRGWGARSDPGCAFVISMLPQAQWDACQHRHWGRSAAAYSLVMQNALC